MSFRLLIFALAFLSFQSLGGASAQQVVDEKASLRQQQDVLFERLFDAPDDLDLMFEYATVSAKLEDFEAAISTLERMLIFNSDLPRVRAELGAMYFNIGSYEVAKTYFDSVLSEQSLPGLVKSRVELYLVEIENRTRRSKFSGQISGGPVFSSNANAGPDEANILLGGVPATLVEGLSEEDFGFEIRASATHVYDLQRPNDDFWKTDFGTSLRVFEDVTEGNLFSLYSRTGPRLSLNKEQFGPKFRPFADAEFVNYGNDPLYYGFGAGGEYSNTLSDQWFAFAEGRVGYREFLGRDENDAVLATAIAGAAFAPTRDIVLRGTVTVRREFADADHESNTAGSIRLSGAYSYDPNIESIDRKWQLDGFAEGTLRFFDDPDPVIDPTEERFDQEVRFGVGHTFFLSTDPLFLRAEGSAQVRRSDIDNFDLDAFEGRVLVGYQF